MPKIKMITVGHCNWKTWEGCCKNLYAIKSPEIEIEHYFVYHYYPIDEANNRVQLERITKEYGLIWLDPKKNIGAVNAFNWALDNYVHAQDFIFGFDPDTQPLEKGWDLALYNVISDPKIGWAALSCEATPNEVKERSKMVRETKINDISVYLCDTPMMISTGVMKMDFIKYAGGVLPKHNIYGGTEVFMWSYMKALGLDLAILKDYHDISEIKNATTDPIYHVWKTKHGHQAYPHNFDVFLKELRFNEGENQHMNTWDYYSELLRSL